MDRIVMKDFLSPHSTQEKVVEIEVEPDTVYLEMGREANHVNFDFVIRGLTDRRLLLKFIKVAVYDALDNLIAYRYLNHNAVGVPGIRTVGDIELDGLAQIDIPNPFYRFSNKLTIAYLRYMFTWVDRDTGCEYYYGDIRVVPTVYQQQVELRLPLKGLLTVLDGHDYYSHHRRFEMTLVRQATSNRFVSNFSRFALDFCLLGPDGNLSSLKAGEHRCNYDFHFRDACQFYIHRAPVLAPADGTVVDAVNTLDDLYETPFDMEQAIRDDRISDIAGNRVIIQHGDREYSHLFHLLQGSVQVAVGDRVDRGQCIGEVGFSGAATTYSHLHYHLLDGLDFLRARALPCTFTGVTLVENGQRVSYAKATLDTGDFVWSA